MDPKRIATSILDFFFKDRLKLHDRYPVGCKVAHKTFGHGTVTEHLTDCSDEQAITVSWDSGSWDYMDTEFAKELVKVH